MQVSDHRSNSYEQIEFAVKTIGRSVDRRKVFDAVYKGKKTIKTIDEIATITNLPSKRVLEEGKKLADNGIVKQVKQNKKTAYQKDSFYSANKNQILSFVDKPIKLKKLPSKRNIKVNLQVERIPINKALFKVKRLYVDDLDSFKKLKEKKISRVSYPTLSESAFKSGIKKIIGEEGEFTDWGGEKNDLLTTKILYKGRRIASAIAFKGPGKKGVLTPNKMGKNGDQIQRLYSSSADLFILQYWYQIHEAVIEQMEAFAKLKSAYNQKMVFYCIVDGQDSERLIQAYTKEFK